MMDVLLLWVTLGFLVEAVKVAVRKCSKGRKEQNKDDNSLREPLLRPEDVTDASGRCTLYCCSHSFQENSAECALKAEYSPEIISEGESDSLPGSIRAFTDDSEEDLEQGIRIIEREDLTDIASVTLVGDKRGSLKGKEIVEEVEDDTTDSDRHRSETSPVRILKESRLGKNSANIYPEPLDPPLTPLQEPNSNFLLAGQSSSEYGLHIFYQASWDHHFKADAKIPISTGECSKS